MCHVFNIILLGCATYPHLLDVQSPSLNFDRIGANSTEVYMQLNTGMPGEGLSRAGIAIKVTIAQNKLAAAMSAETAKTAVYSPRTAGFFTPAGAE